jgi:dipeptidyl aminopeptidase/acylaminoacyl peptidase
MTARYDFERFLNIRSAYGPDFLPDGRVTFITNITGLPQLWAVAAPGAWPTQLTFAPERILYARAAPDGSRMIVGSDAGGDEHVQLALFDPASATVRALTSEPARIHTFGCWSPDGRRIAFAANTRDAPFFDIYTLALDDAGAAPVRVYQQDGSNTAVAWAPDGSALIVSAADRSLNNDLYLVPLDGGAPRLLTPHAGDAVYQHVDWAPDGGSLYLTSDAGRERAALMRFDLATGEWATLAAPAWDVDDCALSPDGARLVYTVNVDGYSELHLLELAGGRDTLAPNLPAGVVSYTGSSAMSYAPGLTWAPDSRRLAFNFSSPTRPLNIWTWDLDSDRVAPLTAGGLDALPAATLATPELIRYPTFDGRDVPAFFTPAPDGAGPGPCVVIVHGGPEGQTRPTFDPVLQYFAHRGYAVLAPNVRGSTGYGREYTHLDDVRLRMDSVRDLAAAAEWLRASGRVDPRRIAVMGGSYGGFMTLAAVTAYPDLWAAGVDIVGIANFVTFLEHTGPWRRKLRESEYGSLEADREFLAGISPIRFVDRITAPMIVIHGANDPRVPVGEAEQIVASLRARNHPVEYLRFADEGHGVVKLHNRLVAYPAIAAFLDAHLRA